MANQLELADIILNRHNVALARSQRLMQSWLPAKTAAEEESTNQQPADDADFDGMTELAGVGSKRKAEDEGVFDGLKRKNLSTNDQLLEQLLGKKAANARRKSQEASRGGGHAAPKALVQRSAVQRRDVESEGEGEGRAASFKSRKAKPKAARSVPEHEADVDGDNINRPDREGRDAEHRPRPARDECPAPAKKQKAGSYLDEILNQKAAKKKSKKKKHKLETAAA